MKCGDCVFHTAGRPNGLCNLHRQNEAVLRTDDCYRRALGWLICEHCNDNAAPCNRDSLECEIVKQEIADRLEQARRHEDNA